jgi:signal peptidase I
VLPNVGAVVDRTWTRPVTVGLVWRQGRSGGPTFRGVKVLEIAPVPHRSTRSERRKLALGFAVLAPVLLLVLLPSVLGLDRFVVTDRATDGSPGRGSVVLAREVPPTDLAVGDVITFRPAGGDPDERVARRILAIDNGMATTESGGTGAATWAVPLTGSSYTRVWLAVPWIGYPFVLDGGWLLLTFAALVAFVLSVTAGRRKPPKALRPERTRLSVG